MALQFLEEMILLVCKARRASAHPAAQRKDCLCTVGNEGASQVPCTPATYSCINGPVKWIIPYSQLFSMTRPCWCHNSPIELFRVKENLDWRCWWRVQTTQNSAVYSCLFSFLSVSLRLLLHNTIAKFHVYFKQINGNQWNLQLIILPFFILLGLPVCWQLMLSVAVNVREWRQPLINEKRRNKLRLDTWQRLNWGSLAGNYCVWENKWND